MEQLKTEMKEGQARAENQMKEGQARLEAQMREQMKEQLNEIKALLMGKNSKSEKKGAAQLE